MELTNLKAFVALAELAKFARASEHLHLSPAAVFGQVRQLEEEIGEKLYERTGRTLTLTIVGRVMLEYAKRILREHDEAFIAIKEVSNVERGVLRFGCGPHTSIRIAPFILLNFLNAFPKIQIHNIIADVEDLFHELNEGRVDLLLANPREKDPRLESVFFWRHERVFIVAPDHPLASRTDIPAEELRKERFILPCPISAQQSEIRQFRRDVGFEPIVVTNHNQPGAIIELVRLGLGISLLPFWSIAEEVNAGKICALRMREHHFMEDMSLIYRKSESTPSVITAFINIALKWREYLPLAADLSHMEIQGSPVEAKL